MRHGPTSSHNAVYTPMACPVGRVHGWGRVLGRWQGAIDVWGIMAICLWKECSKEFEPIQRHQRFCRPECRHAYNNWRKMHGHHLAPRIEAKLQDQANGLQKPVDQMLNEIVDWAIPTPGQSMTEDEIKGVNEIKVTEGE